MCKRTVSIEDAKLSGGALGIDGRHVDLDQCRCGVEVAFEQGAHDPETNVTDDDEVVTGRIARAHPKEFSDYHTSLAELEADADTCWKSRLSSPASVCNPGGAASG